MDAIVTMTHAKYKKNNVDHLKIENVGVEFSVGDAKVHLENLFDGSPDLGAIINQFINENWRSITNEIRPVLANSIEHILREITGRIYEKYSIDEILPK